MFEIDLGIFLLRNYPWHFVIGKELDSVWQPSVVFLNSISTKLAGIEDTPSKFWYNYNEGFWWSRTFLVNLSCQMDFRMFPFDSHDCAIKLGLNSAINYTLLEVHRTYYANASSFEGNEDKLRFELRIKSHTSAIRKSYSELEYLYPQISVNISLRRKHKVFTRLLSEFYGPTWMFSKMALISYSIPFESVPGRMGLLITLYLVTINIYTSIEAHDTRGFSYLDIWISGMMIPIQIGVVQYGILLSISKFANGFIFDHMVNYIKVDLISFHVTLALSLLFDTLYGIFWILT